MGSVIKVTNCPFCQMTLSCVKVIDSGCVPVFIIIPRLSHPNYTPQLLNKTHDKKVANLTFYPSNFTAHDIQNILERNALFS